MLKRFLLLSFLLSTTFLTACGSTANISNAWVDPQLQKKDLQGVLVVAVAKTQESRVEFEDAFVTQLESSGVRAVPSHRLFPLTAKTGAVVGAARLAGLETILMIRYARTVEEQVYHRGKTYYDVVPAYGSDYHDNFGAYYGYVKANQDLDVWANNSYVSLVADLYESATEKPVWQASSVALTAETRDELREPVIADFVKKMNQQKIIQ